MSCTTLEAVAAWVLGELEPSADEAFEEHLFECDACTRNAERMQRLIAQLATALPPVLTAPRREALATLHPELEAVHVAPGQRALLRLGSARPLGLWVMHAPLAGATRVDLEARAANGALVLALSDVPFDAEQGEVVLACQIHYRALPAGAALQVRLTAAQPEGQRPVGEYFLDHEFENL